MNTHYVSYSDAERICQQLALLLRSRWGDDLKRAHWIAIPRGGLIVLGMLSYFLDLAPGQSDAPALLSPDTLTFIVDDCALSGARLANCIANLPAKRIVFAHLFSTPRLRQAILAQEPRIVDCLAASDLEEIATAQPRYAVPLEQRSLLPGKRYWLGQVEPLAFAWNEPDIVIWNEKLQKAETWHATSPARCLKLRAILDLPPGEAGQEAGQRELDISPFIYWRLQDDEVVIWNWQTDQVFGLKDIANTMWRALAVYGSRQSAQQYLIGQYEIDPQTLKNDLQAFVDMLLEKGILVKSE